MGWTCDKNGRLLDTKQVLHNTPVVQEIKEDVK